jgi:hypothetical protein
LSPDWDRFGRNPDYGCALGALYQSVSFGFARDSVRFKLAILNVLAKCPGGRATLDDVRREVGVIIASGDQTEQLDRFSALGDIDIFQSGLVIPDDAGLQITDAGRTLLHSLESSGEPSVEISSTPTSPALKLIDDLIGTEERLRIFDLELRGIDSGADEGTGLDQHQSEQEEEMVSGAIVAPDAASKSSAVNLLEEIYPQIPEGDDDGNHSQSSSEVEERTDTIEATDVAPQDASAFLQRSFGSRVQQHDHDSSQTSRLFGLMGEQSHRIFAFWRRHLARGASNAKPRRPVGRVGGVAFAIVSSMVVVTGVAAALALSQVKSLKSDIAMLHREVLPLKERLARLEQAEKTRPGLDQQADEKNKSGAEKNKAGEIRNDQTALNLSREEIQLVRDYIKPTPTTGAAAPAINVGDTVVGSMIPLPSPLTEKVPKLLGAKFTTRNGSIIIVRRDSRQADAVLGPN